MARVDRLSGAGEVPVVALVVGQPVVDRVIDAAERERRSQFVAFTRVVEDHVQDHFHPLVVKRADHLLEFQHLCAMVANARVRRLGREEAHRVVAPEVPEPLAGLRVAAPRIVLVELLHGHQLDGGDAQILQVRDLLNQTAIGPGRLHAGARIDREPADVQLVNHGRGPRQAERLIAAPVEVLVRDDALWRGARVVDVRERQVLPRRRWVVAHGESGIAIRRWNNRPGARIQHQLVRVEAMPVMGRVRSGDAKAIELPGPNPFEPDVPDVARLVPRRVEDDAAGWRGVLGTIEQVEANASRVPAEDGEVDAVSSHVSAERQRTARSDGLHLT